FDLERRRAGDDDAAEAEVVDLDAAVGLQRPDRRRHEAVERPPFRGGPDLRDARQRVVAGEDAAELAPPAPERAEIHVPGVAHACGGPEALRYQRLGEEPQRPGVQVVAGKSFTDFRLRT